jgi:FeS assembly SUF system protein
VVLGNSNKAVTNVVSKKEVIEKLTKINDPEMGINIYDLGLIYDLQISQTNDINVSMTLTTVNCPVADSFPSDVAKELATLKECGQVKVKLTFEPPWNKEMMSEDAKLALGF